MDLALEEVGSAGGLLGHLAWLFLVIAAIGRTTTAMRIALLLAGIAWLLHALLVSHVLMSIFWSVALTIAAGVQLTRFVVSERGVSFNAEELGLVEAMFPDLGKAGARHLLDQGVWVGARDGDMLTRSGEPLAHLYFLSQGHARVVSAGKTIGACLPGGFIGEVTVFTGEPATVSVEVDMPSRLWCVPVDRLRRYADEHDDVRRALETAFRRSLSDKLVASNRRAVERGGS